MNEHNSYPELLLNHPFQRHALQSDKILFITWEDTLIEPWDTSQPAKRRAADSWKERAPAAGCEEDLGKWISGVLAAASAMGGGDVV